MSCDTQTLPGQSLTDRKREVLAAVEAAERLLVSGRIRVRISPQGAIAFEGLSDADRSRVTDACIYRRIMSTGTALARAEIAKAEKLAGRSVDRRAVNSGHHSHDGGHTWHRGH